MDHYHHNRFHYHHSNIHYRNIFLLCSRHHRNKFHREHHNNYHQDIQDNHRNKDMVGHIDHCNKRIDRYLSDSSFHYRQDILCYPQDRAHMEDNRPRLFHLRMVGMVWCIDHYNKFDRGYNPHQFRSHLLGNSEHLDPCLDHSKDFHHHNNHHQRKHIVVLSLVCNILQHSKHLLDHHRDSYSFVRVHREDQHPPAHLVDREDQLHQQQQ